MRYINVIMQWQKADFEDGQIFMKRCCHCTGKGLQFTWNLSGWICRTCDISGIGIKWGKIYGSLTLIKSSVADPHYVDADADPGPAFHFKADHDRDPTILSDVDPDPDPTVPFNLMRIRIRILTLTFPPDLDPPMLQNYSIFNVPTFLRWCGCGPCFSLWCGSGAGSSFPLWCGDPQIHAGPDRDQQTLTKSRFCVLCWLKRPLLIFLQNDLKSFSLSGKTGDCCTDAPQYPNSVLTLQFEHDRDLYEPRYYRGTCIVKGYYLKPLDGNSVYDHAFLLVLMGKK